MRAEGRPGKGFTTVSTANLQDEQTRPRGPKLVSIYINTRPHEVERGRISFEEVIELAYPTAPYGDNTGYSVMYELGRGDKDGTLVAGQSVKVKHCIRFDVTATDRS